MKQVLSPAEITKTKRRLQSLHEQLAAIGPMMRGTIVTNGKKHKQPYFSLNKNKRTYLMYLGERRLGTAKRLADNYKKTVEIIEEMTTINMDLLKNDATE